MNTNNLKTYSFIFIFIMVISNCWSKKIEIHDMTTADDLGQIVGSQALEVDSIIIRGKVFKENFKKLKVWSNFGNLKYINLYNANVENNEIPDGSFYCCYNLKEFIMPENLVSIGRSAFHSCKSLKNVNLAADLNFIGIAAFAETKLEDVMLPSKLKTVSMDAFGGCEIRELSIPESVETVEANAFMTNINLKKLFLGKNLQEVGMHAFATLINLEDLKIACNITPKFHKEAIDCGANLKIEFCEGVEKIESNIFSELYPDVLECITLPSTIKLLGVGSFHDIRRLKRIVCNAEEPPICINENINTVDPYSPENSAFGGLTSRDVVIYVPGNSIDKYRSQLSFGHYFHDIRDLNELAGINELVESTPDIQLNGNQIIVKTNTVYNICIYDFSGKLIDNTKVSDNYISKPLESGLYIVKAGNINKKIRIK